MAAFHWQRCLLAGVNDYCTVCALLHDSPHSTCPRPPPCTACCRTARTQCRHAEGQRGRSNSPLPCKRGARTHSHTHHTAHARRKRDVCVRSGTHPAFLSGQSASPPVFGACFRGAPTCPTCFSPARTAQVRPVAEAEMFKVLKSGKRQNKSWKRMITKVTFVGSGFTRKPPKYERFIRPTGLRMTKAHVTHPELKV